jgi:hypothetical protein
VQSHRVSMDARILDARAGRNGVAGLSPAIHGREWIPGEGSRLGLDAWTLGQKLGVIALRRQVTRLVR